MVLIDLLQNCLLMWPRALTKTGISLACNENKMAKSASRKFLWRTISSMIYHLVKKKSCQCCIYNPSKSLHNLSPSKKKNQQKMANNPEEHGHPHCKFAKSYMKHDPISTATCLHDQVSIHTLQLLADVFVAMIPAWITVAKTTPDSERVNPFTALNHTTKSQEA